MTTRHFPCQCDAVPLTLTYTMVDRGGYPFRLEKSARPLTAREKAEEERDARDDMAALWKEVARRAIRSRDHVDRQFGVVESLSGRIAEQRDTYYDRAVKAEGELFRFRAVLDTTTRQRDKADERLAALAEKADRAERSRDKALARAERAECHDCRDTTAITDDMVERAQRVYPLSPKRVRDMLTAALTEPPARHPEAKALDPIIDRAIRGCSDITSPETVRTIADGLADEGVRVVTEGEQ